MDRWPVARLSRARPKCYGGGGGNGQSDRADDSRYVRVRFSYVFPRSGNIIPFLTPSPISPIILLTVSYVVYSRGDPEFKIFFFFEGGGSEQTTIILHEHYTVVGKKMFSTVFSIHFKIRWGRHLALLRIRV